MFIIAFTYFNPKVTSSLVAMLGSQSPVEYLVELNQKPPDSECNALIRPFSASIVDIEHAISFWVKFFFLYQILMNL